MFRGSSMAEYSNKTQLMGGLLGAGNGPFDLLNVDVNASINERGPILTVTVPIRPIGVPNSCHQLNWKKNLSRTDYLYI